MNNFQKIIYFFLELQEKSLKRRLAKHLKTSSTNSTSKTVLSSSVTMTLNSETEKKIKLVRKNVEDIVKTCKNNPEKMLEYIESKGTKVFKIENADKILSVIKEEEGLITPLEGIEAIYLNFITGSGISIKSKPMFVMRNGDIDPYYMAHQFYKWYALEMGLPGYDFMSQKIFKIYLNSDGAILSNLTLDEMTGLKEAINRDKEATDLALSLARSNDGAKKALEKMHDGGANI
jgi:hypothetical protein